MKNCDMVEILLVEDNSTDEELTLRSRKKEILPMPFSWCATALKHSTSCSVEVRTVTA